VSHTFVTLGFTDAFFMSLLTGNFSEMERRRFVRALELLDTNEQHRSFRVHQSQDKTAGVWSVSVSDELRMTFERGPDGRKIMLSCSRRYR
jgi:plasmid maintenance system killer protein